MESSIKYWLWLSQCQGFTAPLRSALMDACNENSQRMFFAPQELLVSLHFPPPVIAQFMDKNMDRVNKILGDCDRLGISILTWQDAIYPFSLRSLLDPPLVLYYKGSLPRVEEQPTIAMVGARKPSQYGVHMASRFAYELTYEKALVVTGMAEGIDEACVLGALKAGGVVLSLVAGGLDMKFPPSSAPLYDDVPRFGALMSEYPPGTPHRGTHFRFRNRLLSGISNGVFLVEATETGGSMMTATIAKEQGRDLFTLPGDVNLPMVQGPLKLMQHFGAYPVGQTQHILQYYKELFPLFTPRSKESATKETVKKKTSRVTDVSQRVVPVSQIHRHLKETPPTSPLLEETPPPAPPRPSRLASEFSDIDLGILRAMTNSPLDQDILVNHLDYPAKDILNSLITLEMDGVLELVGTRHYLSLIQLEEDSSVNPEDIPTESEDIPTESEDISTDSEDIPSESEDISTESEDIPSESEDIPSESEDIPTDSEDIPTDSEDIPSESEDIPTTSTNNTLSSPPPSNKKKSGKKGKKK